MRRGPFEQLAADVGGDRQLRAGVRRKGHVAESAGDGSVSAA